jgi:bicarbonate transport system ATP-binding protein
MATKDFLVLDRATKSFPTPTGEYVVLDKVNLTIHQGEFICIIGHSGCGKSTLLNMVSGFSQPTSGTVTLNGQPIGKPGPDRMVVFQGYALLPWLTAYENIYLAVNSVNPDMGKNEKDEIVRSHLAMVGLTEAADKLPGQISGGMKQRVAIARALSIRPRDRARMMEMPEYYQVRNYALDFLYNRYAHDDE